MARPIITEIVLFLLPFLLYAAFLWATREGVLDPASWPVRRLAWLTGVALVLVVVSFIVLAEYSGAPPRSTYVPAHMENGRFVPGQSK
jgi:hypothetical protein